MLTTNYKDKYRSLKVKLKSILYENELFQDELRKLQKELLDIYRDKDSLLEKVLQFEDVALSSSSESEESIDNESIMDEPLKEPPSNPQNMQTAPNAAVVVNSLPDIKPPPVKQPKVTNKKAANVGTSKSTLNTVVAAKPVSTPKPRKRATPSAKKKVPETKPIRNRSRVTNKNAKNASNVKNQIQPEPQLPQQPELQTQNHDHQQQQQQIQHVSIVSHQVPMTTNDQLSYVHQIGPHMTNGCASGTNNSNLVTHIQTSDHNMIERFQQQPISVINHQVPISNNQINFVPIQTTMSGIGGNNISYSNTGPNMNTNQNGNNGLVSTTTIHQSHNMIDTFQQQNVAVIQVPISQGHDKMNYVHQVNSIESPITTNNLMRSQSIQQNHNMIDAYRHHHHHHPHAHHHHQQQQPQHPQHHQTLPEQLSPEELEQHLESRRMEQAALLLPDWDAGLSCEILSTDSSIKFMAED